MGNGKALRLRAWALHIVNPTCAAATREVVYQSDLCCKLLMKSEHGLLIGDFSKVKGCR